MQRLQWRRMFLYWFRFAPVVSVALLWLLSIVNNNSVVYRLRFYGGIAPDAIRKADSSTNGNR